MAAALICSFEGRLSSVEYVGQVLENAATGRRGRLEVGTMRRLNMSEEVTETKLREIDPELFGSSRTRYRVGVYVVCCDELSRWNSSAFWSPHLHPSTECELTSSPPNRVSAASCRQRALQSRSMPTVSGTCTLTGADCAPCAAAIAVESLQIHVS